MRLSSRYDSIRAARVGIGWFITACIAVTSCLSVASCSWTRWSSRQIAYSEIPTLKVEDKSFLSCLGSHGGSCRAETATPPALAETDAELIRSYLNASGALNQQSSVSTESASTPSSTKMLKQQSDYAFGVLSDPKFERLERLMRHLAGQSISSTRGGSLEAAASPGSGSATFSFDGDSLHAYLKQVENAAKVDSWAPALAEISKRGNAESASLAPEENRRRSEGHWKTARVLAFLKAYFSAYFRSGKFVSLSLDAKTLKAKLNDKLNKELPGLADATHSVDLDKLIDELMLEITGSQAKDGSIPILGKVSDRALIARDARKLQFQEIPIAFAPLADKQLVFPKLNFVTAGSESIRVFFEAVGDAIFDTPGDPSPTGCTMKNEGDYRLTTFEALDSTDGNRTKHNVTSDEFGRVSAWANRSEALTGALTGQLVRGISIFSLNNEAVATLVETAIAAAARKGTEKFAWCAYACRDRKQVEQAADPTGEGAGLPLLNGMVVEETKIELR